MRLIPVVFAAALAALAGCGTKTPLSMPPPAPPVTKAVVPATPAPQPDNSNKAADPRQ
jgi:predicted small lipoprotein YifL